MTKNYRFPHLVWDVSGTLWNDLEQVFLSNYLVLKEHGVKTPDGQELTIDWLKENAAGSCVEMFRRFSVFKDENKFSDKKLTQFYVDHLEPASKQAPSIAYEGIPELISRLNQNGIINDVVSAHPHEILMEDLDRVGILSHLNSVKGSQHKKTEAIINCRNGIPLHRMAYIGDTQSDMEYAKKAGVVPIGVSYGYQPFKKIDEAKPYKILRNVRELESFLLSPER